MPKVTTFKKHKRINNECIRDESSTGSVDLFSVSSISYRDSDNICSDRIQNKIQEVQKEERFGTSCNVEKSKFNIDNSEKNKRFNFGERDRIEKNTQSNIGETITTNGEECDNKRSSRTIVDRRIEIQRRKKVDNGSCDENKKSRKETERIPGRERFECGREKVKNETCEDFALVDFQDSYTISPPKVIQCGPFETKKTDEVFIVIDGFRYIVSSNSVRSGKYIQGFDSKFIVSHLKSNKK